MSEEKNSATGKPIPTGNLGTKDLKLESPKEAPTGNFGTKNIEILLEGTQKAPTGNLGTFEKSPVKKKN